LSDVQLKLIANHRPRRIYAFGDKDEGGVRLVQSTAPLQSKFQIKVPLYPKGANLDPAKLTDEQVEKALGKAVPLRVVGQKIKKAKARKGEVGVS
jgi:hypothetical protein